jgi:hypothetical protein
LVGASQIDTSLIQEFLNQISENLTRERFLPDKTHEDHGMRTVESIIKRNLDCPTNQKRDRKAEETRLVVDLVIEEAARLRSF